MVSFILGAAKAEAPMNIENSQIPSPPENVVEKVEKVVEEPKVDLLLEAIIQVESRGKEDCIGDKHLGKPSIGVLQIRPIMVREVNRILKTIIIPVIAMRLLPDAGMEAQKAGKEKQQIITGVKSRKSY